MRILAIHIEGFGKLAGYDLTLSEGMNCLCRDNGWGKTTLSVFIKAMLYGLPSSRVQDLQKNERERYSPWQGGIYGGWMTFETEEGSYRVERTFGATAAKDKFALYTLPSAERSDRFSEKLGEELLGIDADSFERSLFYSERHNLLKDDYLHIQNKISSMGDLTAYNQALKLLDRERKKYVMTGNRGRIAQTKEEIYRLEAELASAEREAARHAELQAHLTSLDQSKQQLTEAREGLEARLLSLPGREATEAYRAQAKALLNTAYRASEEARRKAEMPLPAADELARAKEACAEQIDRTESPAAPATRSVPPMLSILLCAIGAVTMIGALLVDHIVPTILLGLVACGGLLGGVILFVRGRQTKPPKKEPTDGERYLKQFLGRYPMEGDGEPTPSRILAHLMGLERRREEAQRAAEVAKEAENAYRSFLASHPELINRTEGKDTEALTEKLLAEKKAIDRGLEQIANQQMTMQRLAAAIESKAEQLPQIRQRLREHKELLPELETAATVIEKTKQYLELAKQRLSDRYLDGVQERFASYVARLSEMDKEVAQSTYTLTSDFAIRIEEKGQLREMVSMSAGTAELLTLCLRLALSDALFPQTRPPLLLDDPFAEYDDAHLGTALAFLDTVARERQVIYLVCHSSRCK